VVVVLNDQIHAARYAHKSHTSSLAAFTSPGAGALGVVVEDRVRLMMRPASKSPAIVLLDQPPPVAIIPVYGGASPEIIEAVSGLATGICGVVVAALGAGHVPGSWSEPLGRLSQEKPVILASQVGAGPVFTGGYGYAGGEIDLISRGLITAGALTPNKARIMLSLLLGARTDRTGLAAAFAAY
jgi:L-asparaginase